MHKSPSGPWGRLFLALILILCLAIPLPVKAATPELSVPASCGVVLMEASTGQTLRDRNGEEKMDPYGSLNLLIALTACRYASLEAKFPEEAKKLFAEAEQGAKDRYDNYVNMSKR